ncbi:lasso peptide biosynthesis B2 protein [Priestia megaterium]|uniref:lasso peptide biosynthesis B2 protein n=1 Tax=Priestia megaterium TaxID=1404 RepID=UPI00366A9638
MMLRKIYWYWKVYFVIKGIDKILKTQGFKQIHNVYLNENISLMPLRDLNENDVEFIKLILEISEKICFSFFGNARCLHRSLSGYHVFQQRGIPIDLVVGVSKKPFMSHAWLEFNGQVINDSPEFIENLIRQFDTRRLRRVEEQIV